MEYELPVYISNRDQCVPNVIRAKFSKKMQVLSRDRSAHTAKRMRPTENVLPRKPRARAHARKS